MRKFFGVFLIAIATAALGFGADPVVKGETKVKRDSLVELSVPVGMDTAVTWRISPSANVTKATKQPAGQLVFNAPPGTYQIDVLVIDWTAKTISEASETVVIEGGGVVKPPPVDPDKPPPATGLYFLIVRQPVATGEFRNIMSLPAWEAVVKKGGHAYRDFTPDEATKYVNIPAGGIRLPAVYTLQKGFDGEWKTVAGPVDLPTTNDGIAALVK